MALTVAVFIGLMMAMIGLFEALGLRRDPVANRGDRWMAIVAFGPALGAASLLYLTGRRWLQRVGLPMQRPHEPLGEDPGDRTAR